MTILCASHDCWYTLCYTNNLGLVTPGVGANPLQKTFDEYSKDQYGEVMECFNTPSMVNLNVDNPLHIPKAGWTKIKEGIRHGEFSTDKKDR